MEPIIDRHKDRLIELCRRFRVAGLDVFGSAATGDFDDASDIDLLVEFEPGVQGDRFDRYFALLDELTRLFGRRVDLVEPGGLSNPYLIRCINETRRRIYGTS